MAALAFGTTRFGVRVWYLSGTGFTLGISSLLIIFAGRTFPLQKLGTPEAGQLRAENCGKRSFELGCHEVKKYRMKFAKKMLQRGDEAPPSALISCEELQLSGAWRPMRG